MNECAFVYICFLVCKGMEKVCICMCDCLCVRVLVCVYLYAFKCEEHKLWKILWKLKHNCIHYTRTWLFTYEPNYMLTSVIMLPIMTTELLVCTCPIGSDPGHRGSSDSNMLPNPVKY